MLCPRLDQQHSFVDSNKRIGFVAAMVLVEITGYRFTALETEAVIQTLALSRGQER